MDRPYPRVFRVIRRVGILGGRPGERLSPMVIDSEDAPLSTRGRTIFRSVVLLIVVVGVVLVVLARG